VSVRSQKNAPPCLNYIYGRMKRDYRQYPSLQAF